MNGEPYAVIARADEYGCFAMDEAESKNRDWTSKFSARNMLQGGRWKVSVFAAESALNHRRDETFFARVDANATTGEIAYS